MILKMIFIEIKFKGHPICHTSVIEVVEEARYDEITVLKPDVESLRSNDSSNYLSRIKDKGRLR